MNKWTDLAECFKISHEEIDNASTTIVVLNDGETYTSMEGCFLLEVPDWVEDVEDYIKESDESERKYLEGDTDG
tara:strand:- start:579 stop:800 length:222 start_codon:yes stop_codon:yes gene_type:complete